MAYGTDCLDEITLSYSDPGCTIISSGIRQIAFIDQTVISQITAESDNATLWTELINSDKIVPPFDFKGSKPKGVGTFAQGYGDQIQQLTGKTFTITGVAQYTKSNYAFFNDINRTSKYYIAYLTGDKGNRVLFISKDVVNVDSDDRIDEATNGRVEYDIAVTWDSADNNKSYTPPAGIFID